MSDYILTNPTPEERVRIWAASHPEWGKALTLDDYLDRERRQFEIPLSRDGGLTNWVLTQADSPPGSRPLLSSCETLKKRVLVRKADGTITEGSAHGVASVFTEPQFRGHGHASTMMAKLSEKLRQTQSETDGAALISVLWSDIGKKFYARSGWNPYPSDHVEWAATPGASPPSASRLSIITFEDLPALLEQDESLLREELAKPGQDDKPLRLVILPTVDQIHWHLARQGFMTEQVLSRKPSEHGALYTTATGARVWALWLRSYSGSAGQPEKNTFYFSRFVIDGNVEGDALKEAMAAIVEAAKVQAGEWACGKVVMWNPSDNVKTVAESLGGKWVQRESDSIASLNWFGEGPSEDVTWLANEKYAWC